MSRPSAYLPCFVVEYHPDQNDYSYNYKIISKTIDPQQITNITDFSLIPKKFHKKITDVTNIADFCRMQDHGRLTAVHISKHSPSHHVETLKITVGCRLCTGFLCGVFVCIVWCGVVCVV